MRHLLIFLAAIGSACNTPQDSQFVLVGTKSVECAPGGHRCEVPDWNRCYNFEGTNQSECQSAASNATQYLPNVHYTFAVDAGFSCHERATAPVDTKCSDNPGAVLIEFSLPENG